MAHIPRLYIPGRVGPGGLVLDGEQSKRLASVMRLREGDEFLVFAGDGREFRAMVRGVGKRDLRAEVCELVRQEPQAARVVEVWCPVVRPNRFDWAIEKCVEAGVDIVRPLLGEHSARGDGNSAQRQERWQRIAVEAMEQSGRLYPALIERPARFDELLARHRGGLVVADGVGRPWAEVSRLLPERGVVAVVVGPEGGLSEAELARARAKGALMASLGPNILRSETAAVVATALLRAH